MHFIGAVADPQQAAPGKSLMARRIIGAAHRAEHLHGAVGDPLQHRRHRHLDQRYVAPGAMVAGLIEPPRAAICEQPRLFEFDARFRNPALHGVILHHGPSEGGALGRPHHHQFDQEFAQPDRAHAMMNTGRTEPDLRDPEAFAFRAE